MGTVICSCGQSSYTKVKGHLRSSCEIGWKSLVRKGCHFLFVWLFVLFLLSRVCGGCECVCVLRGGGGFCLGWCGLLLFKKPWVWQVQVYDQLYEIAFQCFHDCVFSFYIHTGTHHFWSSVRSIFWLFWLGLAHFLLHPPVSSNRAIRMEKTKKQKKKKKKDRLKMWKWPHLKSWRPIWTKFGLLI